MADNTNQIFGTVGNIGLAAAQGFANPLLDVTAGIGALQTIGGLLGLQHAPDYKKPEIDPEVKAMVDRSLAMAKQGYSPEQIAAFKNNLAENNVARFRHGVDAAGGNLAGAINAGTNAFNVDVFNKFASDDAAKKLANQHYADQTVKYLQSLDDKSWMQNENYRKALNSSFGGAAKQGLSTLTGALAAGAAGYKGGGNNIVGDSESTVANMPTLDNVLGNIPKKSWADNFNTGVQPDSITPPYSGFDYANDPFYTR